MPETHPKLEEICQRTRDSFEKLFLVLGDVDEEQARFRAEEGKWSIGEIAHHLSLAHRGILRGFRKRLREAEALGLGPDPDTCSALQSLDFIAARAMGTVPAPPSAVPDHGRSLQSSLSELRSQAAELSDLAPLLARYDLRQLKLTHHVFGELDLYQWTLLLGNHAGRHRKQAEALKTRPGYPRPGRLEGQA